MGISKRAEINDSKKVYNTDKHTPFLVCYNFASLVCNKVTSKPSCVTRCFQSVFNYLTKIFQSIFNYLTSVDKLQKINTNLL